MIKVTIKDYPITIKLTVTDNLPPFKYGCEARTKIAQRAIRRSEYMGHHSLSDFIVEVIEDTNDGETWHLGS